MSAATALEVVEVVLILGLAAAVGALYREIRLRSPIADGYRKEMPTVVLDGRDFMGRPRTVAALDTTCLLCHDVLGALMTNPFAKDITLLTYEPLEAWAPTVKERLRVVHDRLAWERVAHFGAPMLMRIGADGRLIDLVLPRDEKDVHAFLSTHSSGGSHDRTHV